MPRKRKASAARAEGLRATKEALSAKRIRATPEHSDLSGDSGSESEGEEKTDKDETVHLIIVKCSKPTT
jgi:hypothetical protein